MNEKNTGADLKSATGDGDKKLYIETYGCQMRWRAMTRPCRRKRPMPYS